MLRTADKIQPLLPFLFLVKIGCKLLQANFRVKNVHSAWKKVIILTWHESVGWLQGEVPLGVVVNPLSLPPPPSNRPKRSMSVWVIFSLWQTFLSVCLDTCTEMSSSSNLISSSPASNVNMLWWKNWWISSNDSPSFWTDRGLTHHVAIGPSNSKGF